MLPSFTFESALRVSSGLSSLRLPSWSSSPQTHPQPLPCSHCLGWTESWAIAVLCVLGTPSRPTAIAAVSPNAAAFAKDPRASGTRFESRRPAVVRGPRDPRYPLSMELPRVHTYHHMDRVNTRAGDALPRALSLRRLRA